MFLCPRNEADLTPDRFQRTHMATELTGHSFKNNFISDRLTQLSVNSTTIVRYVVGMCTYVKLNPSAGTLPVSHNPIHYFVLLSPSDTQSPVCLLGVSPPKLPASLLFISPLREAGAAEQLRLHPLRLESLRLTPGFTA